MHVGRAGATYLGVPNMYAYCVGRTDDGNDSVVEANAFQIEYKA